MQESTITAKGQTTLPRDVRKALDLQPGDKVRYLILDGGEVRILRIQPVAGLSGSLKHLVKHHVSLEDMDAAIADGVAGRDK